jgi:hypothetical protein
MLKTIAFVGCLLYSMSALAITNPPVIAVYRSVNGSTPSTVIDYNTQDIDTHNAVTTGSGWVFAAPIEGYYEIYAQYYAATNISQKYIEIVKNPTTTPIVLAYSWGNNTSAYAQTISSNVITHLLAGETIQVQTNWSAALQTNAGLHFVSIKSLF